jgi:RpiB/LacA/LacB family sugar-phosphate isomerase
MSCSTCGDGRVALASDHAGYELKEIIKQHLTSRGLTPLDLGTDSTKSVDYPEYARKVCEAILGGDADKGILICGTGLGMSMMANRYKGIRGAPCHDHFTAVAARSHNDSNVLILGSRILGTDLAKEIVDTWLDTPFEGDRHLRRINKFDEEIS